jgi:predicted nucleic acid-binding protein
MTGSCQTLLPFAVYDPDDRLLPDAALRQIQLLSEMRQSVRHYERLTVPGADKESLRRVSHVDSLYKDGWLVPAPMSTSEQTLAAELQGKAATDFGLRVPLGRGEAACTAISYHRGWTIVTDDTDALKVLDRLHGGAGYPYERIRRLLVRAANEGHIAPSEANRIHAEMRSHGFWDSGTPFP